MDRFGPIAGEAIDLYQHNKKKKKKKLFYMQAKLMALYIYTYGICRAASSNCTKLSFFFLSVFGLQRKEMVSMNLN